MTAVVVFGAGGRAGRAILAEAERRKIEATPVVRDVGKYPDISRAVAGDATDADLVERAARGHDVAIVAVYAAELDPSGYAKATEELLRGLERAGVRRLLMVGIATTLPAGEHGEQERDADEQPEPADGRPGPTDGQSGPADGQSEPAGEQPGAAAGRRPGPAGEQPGGAGGQRGVRVFEADGFAAEWRPFSQARADELAVLERYDGPVDWVVVTPPMELVEGVDRGYHIRNFGNPLTYAALANALLDEAVAGNHRRIQIGISGAE